MWNTSNDSNKRLTRQREGNALLLPLARESLSMPPPPPPTLRPPEPFLYLFGFDAFCKEHEENERRPYSARRVWHVTLFMYFRCWLKQLSEGKRKWAGIARHARDGKGAEERHSSVACVSRSTPALCFVRPKTVLQARCSMTAFRLTCINVCSSFFIESIIGRIIGFSFKGSLFRKIKVLATLAWTLSSKIERQ